MKAFLLTLLLALSVILFLQWHDWPPQRQISQTKSLNPLNQPAQDNPETEKSVRNQPPAPVDKNDYASVTERPLFMSNRRPPEQTPEAEMPESTTPTPESPLTSMDLNAVIITTTGAIAWIRTPNNPKLQKVQIGDDVEGWRVKSITNDEIQMEGSGGTERLLLRNYGQGAEANPNHPPRADRVPTGKPRTANGRVPADRSLARKPETSPQVPRKPPSAPRRDNVAPK